MYQQPPQAPAVAGHGMHSMALIRAPITSISEGTRMSVLVAAGAPQLDKSLMSGPVVLLEIVLVAEAGLWRGNMMLASAPHRTTAPVVAVAP